MTLIRTTFTIRYLPLLVVLILVFTVMAVTVARIVFSLNPLRAMRCTSMTLINNFKIISEFPCKLYPPLDHSTSRSSAKSAGAAV